MFLFAARKKGAISFKLLCFISVLSIAGLTAAGAAVYNLPGPSELIPASGSYCPLVVKGIKLYPDNPFKFDFLIDKGQASLSNKELKEEARRHINYFLASLTIPEKDLWVNLSPYEKDRIMPEELSLTDMGNAMLKEDYILKQFLSSLTHPEGPLGKKFWNKVYQQAREKYGTANIPVNTFNKAWIVPEKAVVYEDKDMAFIGEARLKVMLEEDYKLQASGSRPQAGTGRGQEKGINDLSSRVMKEAILPAVEKEVNEGRHFSSLRQMYHSLILALWYKSRLKDSVIAEAYADRKKIKGIDLGDPQAKEKVYNQYVQAYKTGVYDYIKKDFDSHKKKYINRRYCSGGIGLSAAGPVTQYLPAQNRNPVFSSAITIVFKPISSLGEGAFNSAGESLTASSSLKLRSIEGLPNNLKSIFIVGNWDDSSPESNPTKIMRSMATIKAAFKKAKIVYFTSHFQRPTKEDWENNQDEFSLHKKIVPVVKKILKKEGLAGVEVVELPYRLEKVPLAILANQERFSKTLFVFENTRGYPFQSRYFLGRQPEDREQVRFMNSIIEVFPDNCAVIDEAIASHETDATKQIVGMFPAQKRAAGIAFQDAIDKALKFEARSADGERLFIMGGAKGDKLYKHLRKFVSFMGTAKKGDTFYIIGALAYTIMLAEGIEAGNTYQLIYKKEELDRISRIWPIIKDLAQRKGVNIFFTNDNRIQGLGNKSVKEIQKNQSPIGPGDATIDDIIEIVYRIRDSRRGGILFNGGGTDRKKASDDILMRTDGLIVGAISRTAAEGIPVLFSGADTVSLLNKLKSLGLNISDEADVTDAGGTILAGLAVGMSNLKSVKVLLKDNSIVSGSKGVSEQDEVSSSIRGGIDFDNSSLDLITKNARLSQPQTGSSPVLENMIGMTFDISGVKNYSSGDSFAGSR